MNDAIRAVEWKACSRGHLYLGKECPCEHVNRRYRPKTTQRSSPDGSRSFLRGAETGQRAEQSKVARLSGPR